MNWGAGSTQSAEFHVEQRDDERRVAPVPAGVADDQRHGAAARIASAGLQQAAAQYAGGSGRHFRCRSSVVPGAAPPAAAVPAAASATTATTAFHGAARRLSGAQ